MKNKIIVINRYKTIEIENVANQEIEEMATMWYTLKDIKQLNYDKAIWFTIVLVFSQ